MSQSLGEKRVRIDFNVSGSGLVNEIKQKAAELINLINDQPLPASADKVPEASRLKSLAMTNIEQGAMWAVKGVTI